MRSICESKLHLFLDPCKTLLWPVQSNGTLRSQELMLHIASVQWPLEDLSSLFSLGRKTKKTCYIAEGKFNKRFNMCISDFFFFFKTSKVLSLRIRQWGMTFWSKFYCLQTRSYSSIVRTMGKGISTLEKMDPSQYFSIWTLLNIFLRSSY